MAKTKTPFLSLGSHGSIANTLTSQKRGAATLIRTKPTPAYRYTLLQAYQRWLYEDYAYLWRQQSQATRQEYATAGTRFHLTGFQYWMKYHLTNLPDIALWWKLDEKAGAIAYDSGRNANNGTIIGASPIDGLIAGAQSFDGTNDEIVIPHDPTIDFGLTSFSLEFFLNPQRFDVNGFEQTFALKYSGTQGWFLIDHSTGRWGIYLRHAAGARSIYRYTATATVIGTWVHLVFNIDRPNNVIHAYYNGLLDDGWTAIAAGFNATHTITNTSPLYLARMRAGATFCKAYEDNVILRNRLLDSTEITTHAARRYSI